MISAMKFVLAMANLLGEVENIKNPFRDESFRIF